MLIISLPKTFKIGDTVHVTWRNAETLVIEPDDVRTITTTYYEGEIITFICDPDEDAANVEAQSCERQSEAMSKHPIQPLEMDQAGTVRFKNNAIVCYLLDNGGIDMNKIAHLPFSEEDREQFAQLIGYTQSDYLMLPYVSDETHDALERIHADTPAIMETAIKERNK
jgi:hypothetical protein